MEVRVAKPWPWFDRKSGGTSIPLLLLSCGLPAKGKLKSTEAGDDASKADDAGWG